MPLSSAGDWMRSPYLDRFVARVAHGYGLSASDLEDVAQETRIALWETGPDTRVTAALVTHIAGNKAVDLLRRLIRRRATDRTAVLTNGAPPEDGELRHLLNARVAALPQRLHAFYELHYWQGLSEREIGRAWGLCRASVRWLDHRCRLLLLRDQPPGRARPLMRPGAEQIRTLL